MKPVRILIVDADHGARVALLPRLDAAAGVTVVAAVADPYEARDRLFSDCPDVILLGPRLRRLDGIGFLQRIMRYRPLPVVMITADSGIALRALAAGAVDVLTPPGSADGDAAFVQRLRAAAAATPRRTVVAPPHTSAPTARFPADMPPLVVAVGASTGGAAALQLLLSRMPADAPAFVIAQHMPAAFVPSLVERLDAVSPMRVGQARGGEPLQRGRAFVAPGDAHLLVRGAPGGLYTEVKLGPRVSGHRPSVDVLFKSVADAAGAAAVGMLLTGMGKDGAQGLLSMRRRGAAGIAQDEASSVVYGMPRAAAELGAATHIVALTDMPLALAQVVGGRANPPPGGRT